MCVRWRMVKRRWRMMGDVVEVIITTKQHEIDAKAAEECPAPQQPLVSLCLYASSNPQWKQQRGEWPYIKPSR